MESTFTVSPISGRFFVHMKAQINAHCTHHDYTIYGKKKRRRMKFDADKVKYFGSYGHTLQPTQRKPTAITNQTDPKN